MGSPFFAGSLGYGIENLPDECAYNGHPCLRGPVGRSNCDFTCCGFIARAY